MNPFEFFIPQNITVGAGTLAKLPECAKKLGGSHAMLISGPTLRKMGVVDKAADYLKDAGMAVDIFTDVEANDCNVCEATCPILSPVISAIEPVFSAIACAIRII